MQHFRRLCLRWPLLFSFSILLTTTLSACAPGRLETVQPLPPPHVEVIADGLFAPLGLALLPDGSLLVAEEGTGKRDDSAGVTLITADGQIGRLVSGLPSSRDSGDLAGVNLVGVKDDGALIYIGNFGAGHLWTLPLDQVLRPASPPRATLPKTPFTPDSLGRVMQRLNNVMLVNPFDMTVSPDGRPVVTDASGNGVAIENPDGTTRFFHRFDPLVDPNNPVQTVEAVPTGIERFGEEYLVALTGGCPYPAGVGQVVAVDLQRNQRTVLDGLNMPIDVAFGPDGSLWVLEFATFTPGASCFTGSGYQVNSGRLSRVPPGCLTQHGLRKGCQLETVLDKLNFPGAVLPAPDGSLYISEVFPGRVLRVTFGEEQGKEVGRWNDGNTAGSRAASAPTEEPSAAAQGSARVPIDPAAYDEALRRLIRTLDLHPNPGRNLAQVDPAQAELGRLLFFDPILSGDRNIACATCHHPAFAMADGRVLPIGTGGQGLGPLRIFVEEVELAQEAGNVRRLAAREDNRVHNPFIGQFVPRNSPTILNSALMKLQFWDGRVQPYAGQIKTLERVVNELALDDALTAQALFPVTSLHEMAGATLGGLPPHEIRRALVERLRANPTYVDLFRKAFDAPAAPAAEPVTIERLIQALAAFERTLIFTDAPWDAYVRGETNALNEQQKRGALLFFGALDERVNCAACHSGDLFTDHAFHNLLAPQLGPGKGNGYSRREDWGRANVTFDARDRFAFRTPSLRNVTLTAPYFHNGAFATLEAAIWHHADPLNSVLGYDPSVNGIPPDLYSSVQPFAPERQLGSAAPLLRNGLPLNEQDVADLVAFLEALTDPAAEDLMHLIPDSVPSGLPLDPLPAGAPSPPVQAAQIETTAAPPPQTTPLSDESAVGGVFLRNVASDVGLDFRHGAFRTAVHQDMVAAMGGGLCWIDYDNDGWLDLYVVNSYAVQEIDFWLQNGGLPHNHLYRNVGGRFEDVSAASGTGLTMRGNGCVAADLNNDGWVDLYVTAYGVNALLWNNGNGTFQEGAAAAGVDAPEWSSAAAVADLNDDGWLDLFVGGYIDFKRKIPKPVGAFPQDYYGIPDRLYLNRGPDTNGRAVFEEVTLNAGLVKEERTLGAIFTDVEGDGDLDLYIANDGHPNRLYRNDPWPGGVEADPERLGFRFVDVTHSADVGDTGSGMGVASGDYDGDGRFDLFITNWERELNALYRNTTEPGGPITFQYSTFRIGVSGLGNGMTGWGTHLVDLDNDTDRDLLIVNGRVPVTNLETDPELVRYYRNRTWSLDGPSDRPGHFIEWTQQVGLKELGPLLGRGSALADFDNDGAPDIAINQIAGDLVLLKSSGAAGAWLQVDLGGVYPGAQITVELPDGRQLVGEVHVGSSYLASEDPRLHFGLGKATHVRRVTVRWPNGAETSLQNVMTNQRILLSPP
ncbi:MAG: ScyD/ScyE family protein [Caldilinea sp.]|nr:ScyD/ScyE family protein [Caldilinea sp.]MDW8440749.1 ScyD/ScyE family protein [Caldilineaceae bacterium]